MAQAAAGKTKKKQYVATTGLDQGEIRVEAGKPIPPEFKIADWLIEDGLVKEAESDGE